jgi:hypothetical protein
MDHLVEVDELQVSSVVLVLLPRAADQFLKPFRLAALFHAEAEHGQAYDTVNIECHHSERNSNSASEDASSVQAPEVSETLEEIYHVGASDGLKAAYVWAPALMTASLCLVSMSWTLPLLVLMTDCLFSWSILPQPHHAWDTRQPFTRELLRLYFKCDCDDNWIRVHSL